MRFIVAALLCLLSLPAAAQTAPSPLDFLGRLFAAPAVVAPPVHAIRYRHRLVRSYSGSGMGQILAAAHRLGVPEALALASGRRESGLTCSPRPGAYHGPLQISYATAVGLGYRGSPAGLNSCGAGLAYGMLHLSMCYRRTGSVGGALYCHSHGLFSVRRRA